MTIQEERDWAEDLSRHLVEIILSDHVMARVSPSKVAFAVYEAIKVRGSHDGVLIEVNDNSNCF